MIRVLVVDDDPLVRSALSLMLGGQGDIEVVGEADNGAAGLSLVTELEPHVVLMDIRMPGIDGLEATRRIRAIAGGVAVLVLTMFDDDDTVFGAMRAGAQGYLLKGAAQAEIDRAIRAVVAGEAIFSPGVAQRVLGYFAAPPVATDPFPDLTPREREVLDRVAAGARNHQIAAQLSLSPKTVANHISSIFAKLSVADRSAAIVRARRGGLGES